MQKASKFRYYLKWALWVLLVQLLLINTSASIYAYKFTHFYNQPAPPVQQHNVFQKTWKLFVGPSFYKDTTEGVPSFPCQDVQLRLQDQTAIDTWYSETDSAKGCIIFFHGISVNKSFLAKEAAMFRNWGYNILLVDFRAHGKSGGNNSSFGVKETEEVAKAFEYAKQKGNKKILLYGVSLGAGVCIKAVADKIVKPDALIADMPFGTLRNHLKARASVLGFPSEPFATLVTMWMGIENGYNGFSHNVAHYAKDVHCPVLVEWGEKDRFVKRNEIENVFGSIASANKKLLVYPDADHESFLQVDPNAWEEGMKAFLSTLPD